MIRWPLLLAEDERRIPGDELDDLDRELLALHIISVSDTGRSLCGSIASDRQLRKPPRALRYWWLVWLAAAIAGALAVRLVA